MDRTEPAHSPERARAAQRIERAGLIAILRYKQQVELVEIARAIHQGGVDVVEVPLTTPGALEAIGALRREWGDAGVIGAGTVLSVEQVRHVADAGAQFIVSPVVDPAVIDAAHQRGLAAVPGALSPTEMQTAHAGGADFVKLFPAAGLPPGYIRDILAPLPHLKLVPTGGIDLDNLADWFAAGAVAVGVGGGLMQRGLVDGRDWPGLTALAERFREKIKTCRS